MESEQAQKTNKEELNKEELKKEELEKVYENLTEKKTCPFRGGENCRGKHEKCKLYWEVPFSEYYEEKDVGKDKKPKEGAKKKLLILCDCQFSWIAKLLYDQVGSFEEMKKILLKPLTQPKPGSGLLVSGGNIGARQGGN